MSYGFTCGLMAFVDIRDAFVFLAAEFINTEKGVHFQFYLGSYLSQEAKSVLIRLLSTP